MENKFDYSETNHIKTMQNELQELIDRTNGFEEFYYSKDFGKRLPKAEDQELAWLQLNIMKNYINILNTRINRFQKQEQKFFNVKKD